MRIVSPTARRLSWGLADQAASSAINFGLSIILLRHSTGEEFGAFAITFSVYLLVLNVVRAACTTPLLLAGTTPECERGASALSYAVAAFTAVALVFVTPFLAPPTSTLLMLLAAGLPILIAQDHCRLSAIAQGNPRRAFTLDLLWLCGLAIGVTTFLITDHATLSTLTGSWIGGATLPVIYAYARRFPLPHFSQIMPYLRRHSRLIRSLIPENVFHVAATQLAPIAIATVLTVSTLGAIRGAQTILGPASMLYMGLMPIFAAEARSRAARGSRPLWRQSAAFAVAIGCLSITYGVTTLLIPASALQAIFGSTIMASRPYILPATIALAALSVLGIALTALRFCWVPKHVAWFRTSATTADVASTVTTASLANGVAALTASATALSLSAAIATASLWRFATRRGSRPLEGVTATMSSSDPHAARSGDLAR
jgi:hypothetical protein